MALSWLFPHYKLEPIPRTPDGKGWSFFDGGLQAWDVTPENGGSYTSKQVFSCTNKWTKMGRKSPATPPLHYHTKQGETFSVKSGTLLYEVDGKLGQLNAGESLYSPPYQSHTFWSKGEEDLVVHITVRGTKLHGPDSGFDDLFMRNFYGYLSQCTLQGKTPIPFQMLRFLDDADVVIDSMPRPLGWILNIVLGRLIGKYLAGYPARHKVLSVD